MATAKLFERRTRQREVILDELARLRTHPTAAELHARVRRRLPRISAATVYRNLERLAAAGRIQKFEFAGAESRFDATLERHDHVRCVVCGRFDDLPTPPLALPAAPPEDVGGYQLLEPRLYWLGICPGCRARSEVARRGAAKSRRRGGARAPARPAGKCRTT